MNRNVEIKARVRDFNGLLAKAKELSHTEGTVLNQEDTFFVVPNGRLKLRLIQQSQEQPSESQLIFYDREDKVGPKLSNLILTPVADPQSIKETLSNALGVKGTVRKCRILHIVGQTRVHIDKVEGLGEFMELEVMLDSDQDILDGDKIAKDLMSKLGVNEDDLLTGAYMDMLIQKA